MLIGFHGPAGSGKTSAAMALKSFYHVEIRPFAQPLKDFALSLGWNGLKDDKGRRLLQLLGTECGRECIHPDIWVHHWLKDLDDKPGKLIIADDVRFLNEVTAIKERGGVNIKLINRKYPDVPYHPSEEPIPDKHFDLIIDASYCLKQFNDEVRDKVTLLWRQKND